MIDSKEAFSKLLDEKIEQLKTKLMNSALELEEDYKDDMRKNDILFCMPIPKNAVEKNMLQDLIASCIGKPPTETIAQGGSRWFEYHCNVWQDSAISIGWRLRKLT